MECTMALVLSISLLMLCVCGAAGAVDTAQASEPVAASGVVANEDLSDYANGEVLVGYADGTFEVLTYEDDAALAAGLESLAADENVTLVQPNYSYSSSDFSTQDALTDRQWALNNDGSFSMQESNNQHPVYDSPFSGSSAPGQWTSPQSGGMPGVGQAYSAASTSTQTTAVAGVDINAEEAWEVYDGGSRDVVIALIDTGVDYTHEDLSNAIWVNEDEIAGNGIDDDGNGYIDDIYGWNFYNNNNSIYVSSDEDSHGTHGAGTIAATADNGVGIAGIIQSDHVKIMVLKALGGSDGSGTTYSVIQAILYAEANGASICNLSFGSSSNDRALYMAIANSEMLFVVAAGNDGENTDTVPTYPASYSLDNIISVANLNYNGALHYSSNYGETAVDLAAPGTYIISTTPENSYSYMTGTSMSAPMVTAAAAMVYSYYEDISLSDVKNILLSTAQTLDSLEGTSVTGGMLDLGAAMTYYSSSLSEDTGGISVVNFTDVDASLWYYEYINYVVENGLMNGTSATTFEPDGSATRSMIVTILYRLEGEPDVVGSSGFDDVSDSAWYAKAVIWAAQNGIVDGYDNGSFGPDDAITREQMAAILYRYAQYKDYDATQGGMAIREFDDYENISNYALEAMAWCVNTGILQGVDSTTIAPQSSATRAQIAAILMRFVESVSAE